MVWLESLNIKTTRSSKKLELNKIGRLRMLDKIGSSVYKLALPPSMAIYNTFHISLLEPSQENKFPSQIKEPPPTSRIEEKDEYERDEMSNSRLNYNKLQYRA